MDTEYGKAAIKDKQLYNGIVIHREKFNPLRGLDYANHIPGKIKIVPPDTVIKDWDKDYQAMTQNMIYGEPLNFENLMKRIQKLQESINAMVH